MINLKPCPKCGHIPYLELTDNISYLAVRTRIRCDHCGFALETHVGSHDDSASDKELHKRAEEEVIKGWNAGFIKDGLADKQTSVAARLI